MRFVPVSCLREGMCVAKNLYDKHGQLLVKWGTIIKEQYIERISQLGYHGIYIDDDVSKDIMVEGIISDRLRMKAVAYIQRGFTEDFIQGASGITYDKVQGALDIVEEIVDEIVHSDVSIINMIDLKFYDEYTYYHSVNVCILSIVMGIAMGYDHQRLTRLGLGAILHDIGKVFISKDILNKKGSLTNDEFETMKDHPKLGYQHLKNIYNVLPTVYRCVLDHHERYDGTGYPYQLVGDSISEFGRIVCICDVYDALTSNRPYRSAELPSEAMEYLMANGGCIFDPSLVDIFLKRVAPYPVGTLVRLSNNYIGIVIKNSSEYCLRPTIKLLKAGGKKELNETIWELATDYRLRTVTIVEVVHELKEEPL